MRIAVIIETFPSLSETFISNKVKQLSLRGHQLFVFCNKINEGLLKDLFSEHTNIKVISLSKKNIVPYILLHPLHVIESLRAEGNFRKNIFAKYRSHNINNFSPDIIYFGFSGVAIAYLNLLDDLKGKKVVSCRGTAENVNLLSNKERQENLRILFEKVNAIHCVSAALKKIISPYCRNSEKIFINNPSIDTSVFKRIAPYKEQTPFIILSVGRFIFQKGYLIGLMAIRKFKEHNTNFKWIIAGGGPQHEELVFHIHQMELQHNAVLAGNKNRQEVIELYNQASVFFLPSVTEGIANVALEAMSMELPVVSTRCGGMEEVIVHGKDGLLADVYDHEALAANLLLLYKDAELRILLGKSARRKVATQFDLTMQIDKFENIYYELSKKYPVKTETKIDTNRSEKKDIYKPPAGKSLRIGIVVPQFPSYTETFFINKIIGLCERGHEVIVFCNIYSRDSLLHKVYGFKNYTKLKVVKLDFSKLGGTFIDTIFFNPFLLFKSISVTRKNFKRTLYYNLCAYYLKKHYCDIYHFGYSALAITYLSILEKLPGKIIVSCLGTAENVKPLTEDGRIEKLNSLFNKVDKIHCVSYKMAETIKQYGANEKKIFVNHPGINTQLFSRQKPYALHQHMKILSVGRLVFQKGFLVGVMAIAELKKKFQNFTWTIIGEGPEQEQLLFYIHSLELTNYVKLVGKKTRSEIIEFYEENDIFFLPSVSEGLPNVALEAMSMELPVMCAASGGIDEVVINNSNGILSNNFDFITMAHELYTLCTNYEKRKKLGECARKTIEKNFDLKRYVDVYEKEYYNVIQT